MYEILTIPIPDKPVKQKKKSGIYAGKYPFRKLEIGQCFDAGNDTKQHRHRMITNIAYHSTMHDLKFEWRIVEGKIFIWRVEKPTT